MLCCHAASPLVIVSPIDWLIRHQKLDYLSQCVLYVDIALPPPLPSPHLTTEPVSCLISCLCVSPLWGYCDRRFWLNISVLRILCTVITTIILPSLITDFIGHASCVSSSSPAPGPPLIPPPKFNWIKSTLNGNNSPSLDKKVDKNILIVSRLFYLMSWLDLTWSCYF